MDAANGRPAMAPVPGTPRAPFHLMFLLALVAVAVSTVWLMLTPYYTFAIAPTLAMALFMVLGKAPHLGFYIILFFVPWDAARGIAGADSPFTISKVVGLSMAAVLFLHLVFSKRLDFDIGSNIWRWLGLFVGVALMSAILSPYPEEAWRNFWNLLRSVVFFALALAFISERGFRRTVPRLIVVSIAISTLLSVLSVALGFHVLTMNESMQRVIGLAKNPNHYASFVLFSLPLLVHWFFHAERGWVRMMGAFIFLVNITAVVLTYSRGAFLVTMVLSIALLIQHGKTLRPRHFGFVALVALLATIVAIFFVPDSYWHRQKSISTQDTSVSSRASYVTAGLESWLEHPVIGTGIGTFDRMYSYSRFAFSEGNTRRTREDAQRDAHNTYLEVLVGMGALGIVLFLFMIMLAWQNFGNAVRESRVLGDRKFTGLIEAYRLSMLSLLLYFFMLSRPYSYYFWTAMALSTVSLRLVRQRIAAQRQEKGTEHAAIAG